MPTPECLAARRPQLVRSSRAALTPADAEEAAHSAAVIALVWLRQLKDGRAAAVTDHVGWLFTVLRDEA